MRFPGNAHERLSIRVRNLKFASEKWYLDMLCVALVAGLNPITYFFNCSPGLFMPDTIAYLTMARDLFVKGLLYLPSWAHVDTGLILPPLYPLLIALGNSISEESFKMAEWVSSVCGLLAAIPLYFHIKEKTNRLVACTTCFLIGINYYYFLIAMMPLTEAVFLLALSLTLVLSSRWFNNIQNTKWWLPYGVGMACGMAFLSRQVGLLIILFLAMASLYTFIRSKGTGKKIAFKNFLLLLCGCSTLLLPYTTIVYVQTGHHPLRQAFQQGRYRVSTDDHDVLKEISRIQNLDVTEIIQLRDLPNQDYGIIYAKRRFMRKLTPDASEMLSHVRTEEKQSNGFMTALSSGLDHPKAYVSRLYHNVIHLHDAVGDLVLLLFAICSLSPFLLKSSEFNRIERLSLPGFIIFYLITLSFLTDTVSRYIYLLFPFVFIQVASELFMGWRILDRAIRLELPNLVILTVTAVLVVFSTPKFFTELKVTPTLSGLESEFSSFRRYVNGEPVFSLTPFYSYLTGGEYRILPNDSLDKVILYGKKTGVRWLLVAFTEEAKSELTFYTNVNWYWRPSLEEDYPGLVRYCCSTDDHMMALYEIL
jgi:4-amino-4-deoxy-L-arabinose transferase-like glycosyltransferase